MAVNAHCRIGRIRMKEGGAEVRVFQKDHREAQGRFRDHMQSCLNAVPDLEGHAIVVWDSRGWWARAVHIPKSGFMGVTLLPSFVAEVFRRDLTADVTRAVLRGEA